MKKHKLHQRLTFFFTFLILVSCSNKNFPVLNITNSENYSTKIPEKYIPDTVLAISDNNAKINKEGEMYYDNEYGYRYWKMADGKYYLDDKYSNGTKPGKKTSRKNIIRQADKNKEDLKNSPENFVTTGT